jgi:hypothetical protein
MTREDAIKILNTVLLLGKCDCPKEEIEECLKMAIKALEQEPILGKIRAEIETKYGQCDICEYFEDYDYEENDISEYRPIGDIADILQIIDKYKGESEVNNNGD